MIVRALSVSEAPLLAALVADYQFKAYRNHRVLSRRRQSEVMQAEIERSRLAPDSFALIAGEGDGAAITLGRPLPWDTGFFGIPMGRLDYVLRGPRTGRDVVAAAVAGALDRFSAGNIRHVTLKLDVADTDVLPLVGDHGFRLMDSVVTYIAHPRREPPRPVKRVGRVRPFAGSDLTQVLDITREAYRGYRGRFQLDPHLPNHRAAEFYLEWARACCAGTMADRVLVAEDTSGALIGWASVRNAEPVSSVSGTRIAVGSLGACRAETPGAYATLISAVAAENHAAGVLTEAPTQNSNVAMIRLLESVGALYARGEYTFHAWLA